MVCACASSARAARRMLVGCIAFSGRTWSPKAACGSGGGGGCMGTPNSLHGSKGLPMLPCQGLIFKQLGCDGRGLLHGRVPIVLGQATFPSCQGSMSDEEPEAVCCKPTLTAVTQMYCYSKGFVVLCTRLSPAFMKTSRKCS